MEDLDWNSPKDEPGTITRLYPTDPEYDELLKRLIDSNPAITSLTVLPNWSREWMHPPTGFVATLKADAPFKTDLFRCNMFTASTITAVDGKLNPNPTQQSYDNDAIKAAIPILSTDPPPFPSDIDDELCSTISTATTRVNMKWEPSLGDGHSFIGLYNTSFNVDAKASSRSMRNICDRAIICKSGIDPLTYEQMETFFEECEAAQLTYREVFSDRRIERFKALQRYNRQRLVHSFASAIGIKTRERTLFDGTPIAIHNFETVINDVVIEDDVLTFYSDCARTSDVRHGLIVDRTHDEGPVVFMRAQNTPLGPWENSTRYAFPGFIGQRHKYTREYEEKGAWGGQRTRPNHTLQFKFILSDQTDDSIQNVGPCTRTMEWRGFERELGYDFNNVGTCSPIVVRV